MGIAGSIVVYFLIWWLVIFAVLPWGVRSQHESGSHEPGTEPGAPVKPDLLRKGLITAGIAAVIWVGVFFAVRAGVFDFYPKDWAATG